MRRQRSALLTMGQLQVLPKQQCYIYGITMAISCSCACTDPGASFHAQEGRAKEGDKFAGVRRQRSASLTPGQLQALPLRTAQLHEHFVGTLPGPALERGGLEGRLSPQLSTSGESSMGVKAQAVFDGTLPGSAPRQAGEGTRHEPPGSSGEGSKA